MKKYLKIISFVIIIAMVTALFTGCGEIKKAEAAVNETITAFKELDFETAKQYIDVDDIMDTEASLSVDEETFMENLFGKLEHKIISSEKIDGNTVVVKTEITAVDMKPVLTEFFGMAIQYAFSKALASSQSSEEETNKKMMEMFTECVTKDDLAMVTNEVDIKVVKTEGEWKIESDDALSDALLGGLTEAAEELSKSMNNIE